MDLHPFNFLSPVSATEVIESSGLWDWVCVYVSVLYGPNICYGMHLDQDQGCGLKVVVTRPAGKVIAWKTHLEMILTTEMA